MDKYTALWAGFVSARDWNKQYIELISDLQVAKARNTDIIQEMQRILFDYYGNMIFQHISKIQICKNDQKKCGKSIKDFVIKMYKKDNHKNI